MPAPFSSNAPGNGRELRSGGDGARGAARDSVGHAYLAGDIIAQKYRLTRVLGEGGMGAVWLARNLKLEVDVAVKLIRHELATDETAERLLQEARAAARIGHRSIVRIFDFGETELDDPFIVMELLTGESLRDLLERKGRRLPAAHAVRTLLPIASALVEAHERGIVHRDLKPENVMLVPDNAGSVVPKLVDFGIAKLRRDEGRDDAPSPSIRGTPDYMSPEQASGREAVDEGADVWALAVILYEAMTGHVPFGGPTYAALIFSIMTEEPAPITDQLAGDAGLWSILQQGLAKRSAARPSMRAFGSALAEWAVAEGIESDVAGTSLAAHWLKATTTGPFSAFPTSLHEDEAAIPEVLVPKPPGMPRPPISQGGSPKPPASGPGGSETASGRETELPQAAEPRRGAGTRGMGAAWIAVAGVLAATAILAVTNRRSVTPSPAAVPAAQGSAPVVDTRSAALPPTTAGSTPRTPSAPPAAATATASAEEPPAPAPTSAPSPTAPRWNGRMGPGRQPRKSTLPIAKQPNF